MDYIEYRKMATELVEKVSDLQKKVLIKHTTAILQELHEHVKDQETRIQGLKEAAASVLAGYISADAEYVMSEKQAREEAFLMIEEADEALTTYKGGK